MRGMMGEIFMKGSTLMKTSLLIALLSMSFFIHCTARDPGISKDEGRKIIENWLKAKYGQNTIINCVDDGQSTVHWFSCGGAMIINDRGVAIQSHRCHVNKTEHSCYVED